MRPLRIAHYTIPLPWPAMRGNGFNLWSLGGLSIWALAKRVWVQFEEANLLAWSGYLAFSFLLSLFPLLILLTGVAPYLEVSPSQVMNLLFRYAPPEAASLLRNTVQEIFGKPKAGLISFGALFAIWSASRGFLAIIRALNHAHGVEEDRSFIRLYLTALWLLLTAGGLLFTNLVLVALGPVASAFLAAYVPGGEVWSLAWDVTRWILQLSLALLMLALIYYFAPACHNGWHWISPGAMLALVIWVLASIGFTLYVQNFGNYGSVYGSLGAVIVLMLWFQITGNVIILGGVVNAEIAKAWKDTAKRQQP